MNDLMSIFPIIGALSLTHFFPLPHQPFFMYIEKIYVSANELKVLAAMSRSLTFVDGKLRT